MKRAELNVWQYDIEVYGGVFMLLAKETGKDMWQEFVISGYSNDMDRMVKWLKEQPEWLSGFNNLSYDWQVLQYMLDNHEQWYDHTGMDIVRKAKQFSNQLIDNQKYENSKLPYNEKYFDVKQIDLMSIHGYTNENKRVSLKWLEFMTDMELDESPIPFDKEDLSQEEIEEIRQYCKNDILATEKLWMYTIGECENTLYKGKDKIQERLDTIEEFGLHMSAINYSDVRIGETVNLKGYMEATRTKMGDLYERKKNRKATKQFKYGDCIPSYVKFQTPELKEFHKQMKPVVVNLHSKEEYPVTIQGLVYTIAKGGLHTVNTPVRLKSDDQYKLIEFDVSSQYPRSIVKRGLYPSHLGKEWLNNYKKLIDIRLDAKKKGKTDARYKGISESLKVAVNGGGFGKLNDTYSVQYDPFPHFQCTIGNQFEILVLVERLVLVGIEVLSGNTDGALCRVPVDKIEQFYQICKQWETDMGNQVGEEVLEYTEYLQYDMTTVNDYIAVKKDGTLKQKGDFLTDYELNKNKSKRIVAIAAVEYLTKGTPIEDTVKSWPHIWEFGIAKKSSSDYYYQGVNRKTGQVQKYNKLVRYYCSKGIGEKIWKCKHEHSDKKGVKKSQVEATSDTQVLFNSLIRYTDIKELRVDYDWYISRTWELLKELAPVGYRDKKIADSLQIEMFLKTR